MKEEQIGELRQPVGMLGRTMQSQPLLSTDETNALFEGVVSPDVVDAQKNKVKVPKKTALYFGSFNPLHYGHLAVAEYVIAHIEIYEFLFVLSPHNPHKSVDMLLTAKKRLAALKKEVAKFNKTLKQTPHSTSRRCVKVGVSDIEFSLPEPRYTLNTLAELGRREPNREFLLVVGADSFASMEKWYRGEELLQKYKVIVYPRKGYRVKTKCRKYGAIYLADAPLNNISSTQIREGLSLCTRL